MTLIRTLWGIALNAVKRRKTPATKLSGFSSLHFFMRFCEFLKPVREFTAEKRKSLILFNT